MAKFRSSSKSLADGDVSDSIAQPRCLEEGGIIDVFKTLYRHGQDIFTGARRNCLPEGNVLLPFRLAILWEIPDGSAIHRDRGRSRVRLSAHHVWVRPHSADMVTDSPITQMVKEGLRGNAVQKATKDTSLWAALRDGNGV